MHARLPGARTTRHGLSAVVIGWILTLALVAPPALAARHRPPPPDLLISAGSVGVLHGRVNGSFAVANAGSEKAPATTAKIRLRFKRQSRLVASYAVGDLKPGHQHAIKVSAVLPESLGAGSDRIVVCADADNAVKERSEKNNCLTIGSVRVRSQPVPRPAPAGPTAPTAPTGPIGPTAPTAPTAPTGPTAPPTTIPARPLAYTVNTPQDVTEAQGDYWVDVPPSYDASNLTPETLLVWLHGCGGEAEGDTWEVSPGDDRSYIAISIGGRDDDCWDPDSDVPKVLTAVADVKTHFNINPRRVIIAGYSSGGDLAYRTIFDNAAEFAGILAENTSPFRDTGSTQSQSLAAASWNFNDVHLAHTEDDTYPLEGVATEIDAMKAAGFPVTFLTAPGSHYDPDDDVNDTGTDNDLRRLLLPHINDGWLSP